MYWLYKSDFGWKANWAIQGEALRTHGNSQQWDSASRELPFICEPQFQWLFSEPKIRTHSLCQKIFLLFLGGSGDPRDVCIFSAQQSVTFKILMAYAEMAEFLKSASPPKSNMVTSYSSATASSSPLEEAGTVVFLLFSVSLSEVSEAATAGPGRCRGYLCYQLLPKEQRTGEVKGHYSNSGILWMEGKFLITGVKGPVDLG